MALDDKQIQKFQLLWKQRFGEKISKSDALEKGIKLLRLVELVYHPISEAEYQELQERRRKTGDL